MASQMGFQYGISAAQRFTQAPNADSLYQSSGRTERIIVDAVDEYECAPFRVAEHKWSQLLSRDGG
jgi:hypothetical protein